MMKSRVHDLVRIMIIHVALDVGIDEAVIKKIAKDIDGFSGREIAKLMVGRCRLNR